MTEKQLMDKMKQKEKKLIKLLKSDLIKNNSILAKRFENLFLCYCDIEDTIWYMLNYKEELQYGNKIL